MIHEFPTKEQQAAAVERDLTINDLPPGTWAKLGGVTTQTATSCEESFENVKTNISRLTPWFHQFFPVPLDQRRPEPIALIGGGPSVKNTILETVDIPWTMACGSAHDWVQLNAPKPPTFCVVCDPDPIMANYLRHPCKDTLYMIASNCHDDVFKALNGCDIMQWHCWPIGTLETEEDQKQVKEFLQKHTPGWVAVGGGCTVGLRSITIATMMGFSNLHFFGFDSCLGASDDAHHAYSFTDETKEFLGDIYNVRIGMNDDVQLREYRVAGYQLAQADHYKLMKKMMGDKFTSTFHGPGLLADFQSLIDAEAKRLEEEKAA